ncbi:membrane transporter-1 [Coleophoma cylindrospora]|uniref:Membrane transporter-1 n=1 Tax=Coleophoma cylindrospora TaxID=1849047 RepID=A0A3D8RLF7_9HELO|nr:membrane transporter-1 [Coleophoma cylindrospora]
MAEPMTEKNHPVDNVTGDTEARAANGESEEVHHLALHDVDEAAAFVSGFHGEIDPKEAHRVLRKIDWNLLPLMMILYFVQFTDKTTLGSSSILGIKTDNHLSASEYNWLGTIFYLAYLVFEWPQTLGLQKFPPGKWMACNILVWGVVLCAQAACHSFAGLFVCRLLLGICEGCITAGFLIVTSMFYTHVEATRRVGFWFLMNGTAQIFNGVISFAVLHVNPDVIHPWRLYMIITGAITLVVGICFWFFIPDNPMKAHFLSKEEKIIAIERLRSHSTGIENKTWKKDQFLEALTDWKPWAFAVFAALNNVPNSLTNQSALIIQSFGFKTWQTTLLGCVSGVIEILTIYSSTLLVKKFTNARAIIGACYFIPNIVAGIMIVTLSWDNKGGLLTSIYLGGLGTSGFVLALSWCAATNTGHTKKTTTNAMLLIGYCLGNLLSPQMWKASYAPRYYIPWGVILATYVICPCILLGIGYALWRENKRRDRLMETGEIQVEKFYDENDEEIDPTFLDITDRIAIRYKLDIKLE